MKQRATQLLEDLTQINAISGHEKYVSRYLKQHYEALSDEIIYDNLGSIFAIKKSKVENAPKVMISAHMDEVGFLVKKINDNGTLSMHPIGGWFSQNLLSHRVTITNSKGENFKGAIASLPPHLLSESQLKQPFKIESMLIDMGAQSKQEVLDKGIKTGDMIVLDGPFEKMSDDRILAKAFDNRYGCAMTVQILEEVKDLELPFDLVVGATVQEEVGLRGAKTAAHLINPDLAIVLDCSPANDLSGDRSALGFLGEGVLVRVVDSNFIAHTGFIEYFIDICQSHNIKHQFFISAGGTDAGAIHTSLDGIPTLTCCISARNIHSSSSIMDLNDYQAALIALKELLNSLNEAKIELIRDSNR